MKGLISVLEKLFKLSQNKTNVKTEVMAGITTFMTMAYILAVNPSILADAGMDPTAVLLATALASFIGTACMAFMANLPFALSAGMGLNAFLAYTVVLGMGYTWQVALLAVFVEGLIFIVLSLTNVREAIFNAIPLTLKRGVSVGIGLFIAFIGLQNAKLCVDSSTLVTITILKVIECWNSYVWPRLITDDPNYYLVSNGIQEIRENGFGRENIPAMMSAVVVISVPLILLFLIFHKKIMAGVARGGTKG